MNKQALLDSYIHDNKGKWQSSHENLVYTEKHGFFYSERITNHPVNWFIMEFINRAEKLGYINGYRWGVEYVTKGVKPDLPDNVIVETDFNGQFNGSGDIVREWNWRICDGFKITDQRYKPADTSYLKTPTVEPVPSIDWYDYEVQKAVALPPVGEKVETCNTEHLFYGVGESGEVLAHVENTAVIRMSYGLGCFTSEHLRPLDYNSKAEKKRVCAAVVSAWSDIPDMTDFKECFSKLYDLGYLRMPEGK
jgi:hypothetical protein